MRPCLGGSFLCTYREGHSVGTEGRGAAGPAQRLDPMGKGAGRGRQALVRERAGPRPQGNAEAQVSTRAWRVPGLAGSCFLHH